MTSLGIIVNPMSGRDVRRVAARASTMTHLDKSMKVARIVLAALEQGVQKIYLGNEPFRISERAVENLPGRERVELLSYPLTHTGQDSITMARMMFDRGVRTFVVLGGDGTNRMVASEFPDIALLPLSTGTNNVFPYMVEPSVAGAAAGVIASGALGAEQVCLRCKRVHVHTAAQHDIALVDAVLVRETLLGNLLPFEADRIAAVVLARSEAAAIGMSPIGGYLVPSTHEDDSGVLIRTGTPAIANIRVPLSAGYYGDLAISEASEISLGQTIRLVGPGIMAYDGDRTTRVGEDEQVSVSVKRDGPWIIDPTPVLRQAARERRLGRISGSVA